MQPYSPQTQSGLARASSSSRMKGFTAAWTKWANAAKRRLRHAARQEGQRQVRDELFDQTKLPTSPLGNSCQKLSQHRLP